MYFLPSDVRVLWLSHHLFHLLALLSVIRGLTTAALLLMLDLWSSRRIFFVETWSSGRILSSAVNFAAAVLWCLDTIISSVWRSIALSFGFQPQFLPADDVFPWSVYVVITFRTAALDTPNEVAVWLQIIIIIIIIYLSWSWATCWPVPVSCIQKPLQRSAMIPSASWGTAFHYPG
jgi:hypothetical protein